MTRWDRARPGVTYTCGGCGRLIETAKPVFVITLPGLKAFRYRCEVCEGPAPPDLPELVVLIAQPRAIEPPVMFRQLLPLDFRRQSGDR
jgi:hypothetical protein